MLRAGLTGGLGSGKSTAAALFAAHGAYILSSDEIARELMQPGQPVYDAIVSTFGSMVVLPDGRLDRPSLARLAFADKRVDELNAIIHPATIDRQTELIDEIETRDARAVVIVESALILETRYGGTKDGQTKGGETKGGGEGAWRHRFDKLILVTAPEELRIARFISRTAPIGPTTDEMRSVIESDARRRIAQQLPDEQKAAFCDYVLTNSGLRSELEWQVDQLWPLLKAAALSGVARDETGP